jgi:hypothetical protein
LFPQERQAVFRKNVKQMNDSGIQRMRSLEYPGFAPAWVVIGTVVTSRWSTKQPVEWICRGSVFLKIGYVGLALPEGKTKYNDERLNALSAKDRPKKVTPFYAEFVPNEFDQCDVIVITKDDILDLLIHDMEKIETRIGRTGDPGERAILQRCLESLEDEIPLCDLDLGRVERHVVEMAAPYSLKPVIQVAGDEPVDEIISQALERSGLMFFYTSGPRESHAWLVDRHSDIVSCAAKIHTDMARGFIKGDVVTFEDYLGCHSFNDCRSKGLARLTDRDYVVQPGDVIEIRFNVAA